MARTIAKDYTEKRTNILSVAAEVFAREGIARASMNEIAKTGGISKANIYHYYSSKDALVFDILDSYLSELRNRVCELDINGLAPEEQFSKIVEEFLLAYEGMDHEHKIQTEGLPLLPLEQQNVLKDYQREMVSLMSSIISKNAPEKLSANSGLLRDTTMSVFGMLNWFYIWNPKANRQNRIDYAKTVTALTLNGLTGLAD